MRQFGGRANRVGPPTFGADPFSVLDSGAAHQSLPDASPPGFGGDPEFPMSEWATDKGTDFGRKNCV